jgi:hypothetical protein
MDAVGHLLGALESPRAIRDYCADKSPSTAETNALLYDAWATRNKASFVDADEALQRADSYMRQRKSGQRSIAETRRAIAAQFQQEMEKRYSDAEAVAFCNAYPDFLERKDREFPTKIPQLLGQIFAEEAQIGFGKSAPN